MARFSDVIGFGHSGETKPGVWEDVIVEKSYRGDVLRNTVKSTQGENVNNNLSLGNSISILADAYANENLTAIKYVRWMGTLWTVSDIEVQRPRLILSIGEVYNGPRPAGAA